MAEENNPLPTPLDAPGDSPLQSPLLNTVASMQEEQKAMKGGNGGLYAGGIVVVLLIIAGVVGLVTSDSSSEYGDFGSSVNGLHQQKFNGFWTCALQIPAGTLQQITSNTTMMNEVNQRASTGKIRFLDMVRDRCLSNLTDLEASLNGLIPPPDLLEQRRQMRESVLSLLAGWASLRSYITRLDTDPYDDADARESVEAITRAWFEYRQAHRSLNSVIADHVGDSE